jgi:hypothetical protein
MYWPKICSLLIRTADYIRACKTEYKAFISHRHRLSPVEFAKPPVSVEPLRFISDQPVAYKGSYHEIKSQDTDLSYYLCYIRYRRTGSTDGSYFDLCAVGKTELVCEPCRANLHQIKEDDMNAIPILKQGGRPPVCLPNDTLPLFYMNDYSVLGLQVSDLDMAYQVLADQYVAIERKTDHLEIKIERSGQMPEIVTLLKHNGIGCSITDIADQIYQG